MLRVLIPLAMVASALLGWLGVRRRNRGEAEQWRDSSLDDWRRERAERAERDREGRLEGQEDPPGDGDEKPN
ncbi:MAG: hypothetical protein ACE5EF_10305 [Dehalococcoidia bacterium]